jgi:polyferredoxin
LTCGGSSAEPDTASSRWATVGFWDALLVANVSLAAVLAWILWGSSVQAPPLFIASSMGLFAYVCPFAAFGIITGTVRLITHATQTRPRPQPHELRRLFWVCWAMWALLASFSAVGLRSH